jgi:hypothetical protein
MNSKRGFRAVKSAQSSKLKGQRAIEINPFQLLASGFQFLCNAADWVFSTESSMMIGFAGLDSTGPVDLL